MKENLNPTNLHRSKYPGRLLPTASTFGPFPNYGGGEFSLPIIKEHKKGCFASGKLSYAPLQKKRILGEITRANTNQSKDKEKPFPAKDSAIL